MVNYNIETEASEASSSKHVISDSVGKAVIDNTEFPYISKSRVKEWVKCPRSFYYSYVIQKETEETDPMRRGTRIHLTFERFYENAQQHFDETGEIYDDLSQYLPEEGEAGLWIDWVDPYVVNFLMFEQRRLDYTREHTEDISKWFPVSIEEEGNLDDPPVKGSPPFFGYSDAIYHAVSFPDCPSSEGVVVVDFKTGSTPDKRYRREGILLELEFYFLLFREKYDVTGVAGYYPKGDDVISAKPNPDIREFICDSVQDILDSLKTYEYTVNEQPLCSWSPYEEGENTRCSFYEHCPSSWATAGGKGPTFYDSSKEPLDK